jgi:chromosome segregation ATPase
LQASSASINVGKNVALATADNELSEVLQMAENAPVPPLPIPSTPEDDLAKKQAALKAAQEKVATVNQEVSSLQDDIKALQSKIAEIQQAQAGYDKTSVSQQQQLDDDKKTLGQKSSIAEAVLKDLTNKIDGTVKDFDDKLTAQTNAVQKAGDGAQQAAKDAKDADGLAQQRQAEFDALKKVASLNDSRLKEIGSLLEQTAKAEAQNEFIAMYFLAGEANKIAGSTKILSTDEYNRQLRTAQDAVEKAKTDAAEKKTNAEQLLIDYNGEKQKLDAAHKSRRTDLLNVLKALQPKPA